MKKKFKHVMLKEIFEQPDVLSRNIIQHLDMEKDVVAFNELEEFSVNFRKINRVTFLGCGTSSHAAMLGNYYFEELVGLPCEYELADEFNRRRTVIEPGTLFVIVSQSGETAEALTAAKKIKAKKLFTLAITNARNSSLVKLADAVVLNNAGEEKAVAATKTFTSTLVLLILLAFYIRVRKIGKNLPKEKASEAVIIREIKKLPMKINQTLRQANAIKKFAKRFKNSINLIVLGEKYNYPAALEGALKLKETTYIKAEGIATGEFKHGPMALVAEGSPVIFLCPQDKNTASNLSLAEDMETSGAKLIIVANSLKRALKNVTSRILAVPETLDLLSPAVNIVLLQLFSYYLSIARGNNPDKPRHLKKIVGAE